MPRSGGCMPRSQRLKSRRRSTGSTKRMIPRTVSTETLNTTLPNPSIDRGARNATEGVPYSGPAIFVAGVSYAYGPRRAGSRRALVDVSLEIQAGEIFAVLGPNGGGKTQRVRRLSMLVSLEVC